MDQELADLYLTTYDVNRNWGSEFNLKNFVSRTVNQARAFLFLKLTQANARILSKQQADAYLDPIDTITQFSRVAVEIEPTTQAPIFYSVADCLDASVTKLIVKDYKPTTTKQVISPVDILPSR